MDEIKTQNDFDDLHVRVIHLVCDTNQSLAACSLMPWEPPVQSHGRKVKFCQACALLVRIRTTFGFNTAPMPKIDIDELFRVSKEMMRMRNESDAALIKSLTDFGTSGGRNLSGLAYILNFDLDTFKKILDGEIPIPMRLWDEVQRVYGKYRTGNVATSESPQ